MLHMISELAMKVLHAILCTSILKYLGYEDINCNEDFFVEEKILIIRLNVKSSFYLKSFWPSDLCFGVKQSAGSVECYKLNY